MPGAVAEDRDRLPARAIEPDQTVGVFDPAADREQAGRRQRELRFVRHPVAMAHAIGYREHGSEYLETLEVEALRHQRDIRVEQQALTRIAGARVFRDKTLRLTRRQVADVDAVPLRVDAVIGKQEVAAIRQELGPGVP